MRALSICLILFIAALLEAADKKDNAKFSPGPASSYPNHQTNDKVTLAAQAFDSEELAHTAFGKLDPNKYGVLPVLVIIQNDTDQALKLDHVDAEYTRPDNRQVEATPAEDIQTLGGPPKQPTMGNGSPLPKLIKHKNPLSAWEIEGRAFAAKMIPPHESASGFFYFQVTHLPGGKFYLSGIKIPAVGKDLLFFEVGLDKK
ncbi:MAG TPA: hypothetical protein VKT81_19490 [Bryobacteraceae bacterium]|nr:hypothetical protein [Bryobacteraceae bacterium]